MARLYPLQQSFSTGQISPFLAARTDLEAYKEGVQTLQNFVADARGPVRMRTGTKFVAEFPVTPTEDDRHACNILPVDLETAPRGDDGEELDHVLVFYADKAYLYNENGFAGFSINYDVDGEVEKIQFCYNSTATEMYIVHPRQLPIVLVYGPPPDDPTADPKWSWLSPVSEFGFNYVPNTALPEDEAMVPAEDFLPATICLYQGRLWLGNFPGFPMTFMGSKSGNFLNFDFEDIQADVPSEPVNYNIAAAGAIQWMVGQRTLILGTTYGEYIANTPDGQGVLGGQVLPDVVQQSAFGSELIQAVKVAQGVFYVTSDSERLRDIRYQWVADGFLSNDISFLFKGSTSSRGLPIAGKSNHFIKLAYSQNPFSIIWLPDRNGGMSGCSFEMVTGEKSVFGWGTYPTQWSEVLLDTGEVDEDDKPIEVPENKYIGLWKSVCVTQKSGRSTTWVLADRSGQGLPGPTDRRKISIEKGTLPDEEFYIDSYTSYTVKADDRPTSGDVSGDRENIPGLTRITSAQIPRMADGAEGSLFGKTVRVVTQAADDSGALVSDVPAVIKLQTLGEEGVPFTEVAEGKTLAEVTATILKPGSIITIGYPYRGKMVTLPTDKEFSTGSTMTWKKHWSKIVVRSFESSPPLVNGRKHSSTLPSTPMLTGTPPIQQIDFVYRNLGWDSTGRIYIDQHEPVKTQILGIFGEQSVDTV